MAEYISREAMIEELEEEIEAGDEFDEKDALINKGFKIAIKDIKRLPAADVQPVRHGRWIEQKHTPTNGYNYNVPYSTYICSSCGLEIHNDEYSKYVRGTYTNCPVCTAKMNIIYEDDKIRAIKVTGWGDDTRNLTDL